MSPFVVLKLGFLFSGCLSRHGSSIHKGVVDIHVLLACISYILPASRISILFSPKELSILIFSLYGLTGTDLYTLASRVGTCSKLDDDRSSIC